MRFGAIIRLIRPIQWVKNGFAFLPMFFGGRIGDIYCWHQSIIVFFAFSFVASAVYCVNDIVDVEADRRHPKKCYRPIASGAVSVTAAKCIAIICVAISCILCCFIGTSFPVIISIIIFYLIINMTYCFKLKHIGIIDVMIVSLGFVLRLVAGGVSCDISLSPWIVSLTFLLALFLAFAKRRDDVSLVKDGRKAMRKSVVGYNLDYLNQTLGIIGSVTIVCYIMYTVSPDVVARIGSEYLYITSVFVIGGILRYLQLTIVAEKSGSPTKVLMKDRFIQAMIVMWIFTFIFLLYL